MTGEAEVDRLEAAFVACGLLEGYPTRRASLAGSLILGGFTAADVETVSAWAKRNVSAGKRDAATMAALEDHKRLRELLSDIAIYRKSTEAAAGPTPVRDLDEIDVANRIRILVDVDHHSIPDAAAAFSLTPGVAQELLAKARARSREHAPTLNPVPAKSTIDHGARVERFKKAMVVSRKRGIPITQALAEEGK